jgi:diguanylate cyclase (GGDEF)-like protein
MVSVIFMDLDRFKNIVDTYGHLNGSRTLKAVAHCIRETLPEPAYAVAYAGDEFVVVLPGFDPVRAMEQANKIQACIKNQVFLRDQGLEVKIQSSFGVATFPLDAKNMANLLTAADHALFAAKDAGKDRTRSTAK